MFFLLAAVQLVPDGSLFVHIAIILMMIWILNRTFFRPINRIIESREANKGGKMGEAESILQEVGAKQTLYNDALRDARSEGYQLVEGERSAAVAAREQLVSRTKAETAQKLAAEREQITRQTAEARTAIAAESEKMADRIAANILKA